MIIGIISFGTGIYLYSKPIADINTPSGADRENNNQQQLEKVIEMAIADGVLTNNERKLIENAATESGLNAEEILQDVEARLEASTEKSETAIIDQNKKSGDDFEKFIVQKFDKRYYKVKEWAGDKYIDGIYAETTLQPDLIMELNLEYSSATFAVECKWRRKLSNGGIEVATPEQLIRYKAFGEKQNMPVFMAIGLGGEGDSPEQLFIVPIQEINENYMHIKTLYKHKHNSKKLFYDIKTKQLK